jgi:hypothetical protein
MIVLAVLYLLWPTEPLFLTVRLFRTHLSVPATPMAEQSIHSMI